MAERRREVATLHQVSRAEGQALMGWVGGISDVTAPTGAVSSKRRRGCPTTLLMALWPIVRRPSRGRSEAATEPAASTCNYALRRWSDFPKPGKVGVHAFQDVPLRAHDLIHAAMFDRAGTIDRSCGRLHPRRERPPELANEAAWDMDEPMHGSLPAGRLERIDVSRGTVLPVLGMPSEPAGEPACQQLTKRCGSVARRACRL